MATLSEKNNADENGRLEIPIQLSEIPVDTLFSEVVSRLRKYADGAEIADQLEVIAIRK